MAIIDPRGLFGGDRLRRCSNAAQLHWPRLFLASDGFGRLEINYALIVGKAYPTFKPFPSETELHSIIQEYAKNFLLFMYEVRGQIWGQWDTKSELLPHATKLRTTGGVQFHRSRHSPNGSNAIFQTVKHFRNPSGTLLKHFFVVLVLGKSILVQLTLDQTTLPTFDAIPWTTFQTPRGVSQRRSQRKQPNHGREIQRLWSSSTTSFGRRGRRRIRKNLHAISCGRFANNGAWNFSARRSFRQFRHRSGRADG